MTFVLPKEVTLLCPHTEDTNPWLHSSAWISEELGFRLLSAHQAAPAGSLKHKLGQCLGLTQLFSERKIIFQSL